MNLNLWHSPGRLFSSRPSLPLHAWDCLPESLAVLQSFPPAGPITAGDLIHGRTRLRHPLFRNGHDHRPQPDPHGLDLPPLRNPAGMGGSRSYRHGRWIECVIRQSAESDSGTAHLSPVLMSSANSAGGVMGKMIAAQSIVVATAATNQAGKEAEMFKVIFHHSITLAILVGLLVMFYAYVSVISSFQAEQ